MVAMAKPSLLTDLEEDYGTTKSYISKRGKAKKFTGPNFTKGMKGQSPAAKAKFKVKG